MALTTAVLGVALVVSVMALIQAALFFHGRAIAGSAARHGLEAARVTAGSEAAGRSAATQYIDQAGGPVELSYINVSRGETDAIVTVSGSVISLLPGLDLDVSVTTRGPVERFEP